LIIGQLKSGFSEDIYIGRGFCSVPGDVAVLASVVLLSAVLCSAVDEMVVSGEVPLVEVTASIG